MSDEDNRFLMLACLMLGIPFRLAEQVPGYTLFWHPTALQSRTRDEAMSVLSRVNMWKALRVSSPPALAHYTWKLRQLYPDGIISFTSGVSNPRAEQLDLFAGEALPLFGGQPHHKNQQARKL